MPQYISVEKKHIFDRNISILLSIFPGDSGDQASPSGRSFTERPEFADQSSINALTKQQLQQALIHLIKVGIENSCRFNRCGIFYHYSMDACDYRVSS